MGQDDVRRERDQLGRVGAMAVGVAHAPAVVDPYIAAFAPAQFLQRLQERDPTGPRFRIVLGQVHEHTDAPHPLDRLRARRQRPRGRRAAEQRDELAAPCMSGKQHSEGRRGFGHDRLPVATGSPQALRILNRE